ncbi:hypothetical protein [Afifella marina]|uniref:Heat shock protein HslJ n=1 Tax=Afifella marina DSM 2698 TaxID=1120955 RepID=A0A1G5NA46_AFIMA|nr:hypothetical protein [Afifella marina]MBK1623092.1 hypothetical protein [Afifella marina DSM 2698]MBK1626086.1 hypothetical protein [Afifella marina]MBK5916964.1 hypothetical protein [Afifella marina]RAI21967.1 hypothetical protein CH311_04400 [Afifella marina DSM 2698]SCZ34024.1 hypothetical protein SAMN03080610_01622 [Afifella marina DSM 2698]
MQTTMRTTVCAFAAYLICGVSAHAQNAGGVWFGGYKQGRDSINLQLTNIEGVGRLEVDLKGWEPIGYGRCQYVYQYPNPAVDDVHLNGSYGTPDKCPSALSFQMERAGPDSMKVTFTGGTPLAEAELVAGLRPLRDEDRRVTIDNLDILGIKTGMSRADVEAVLKDAGYEHDEESTRVATGSEGWTLETHYFDKGAGDDESDTISIAYSETETAKVMIVGRDWKIPESAKLSELTLKQALLDKYGSPLTSNSEERAYDRQGNNLTDSRERRRACKSRSLQEIQFEWLQKGQTYRSTINLYCGPLTNMRIGTKPNTGLASNLLQWIADPDEIWDNFWRTWSIGEHQTLAALYQSVAGAVGEAPKL